MTTARSVSIFGATLAMLLMAMPGSAQTTLASVLADVPTGTYTLNFIKDLAAPADSPTPTTVNFVLAADGRLCGACAGRPA
jgi:ribonuclease PH